MIFLDFKSFKKLTFFSENENKINDDQQQMIIEMQRQLDQEASEKKKKQIEEGTYHQQIQGPVEGQNVMNDSIMEREEIGKFKLPPGTTKKDFFDQSYHFIADQQENMDEDQLKQLEILQQLDQETQNQKEERKRQEEEKKRLREAALERQKQNEEGSGEEEEESDDEEDDEEVGGNEPMDPLQIREKAQNVKPSRFSSLKRPTVTHTFDSQQEVIHKINQHQNEMVSNQREVIPPPMDDMDSGFGEQNVVFAREADISPPKFVGGSSQQYQQSYKPKPLMKNSEQQQYGSSQRGEAESNLFNFSNKRRQNSTPLELMSTKIMGPGNTRDLRSSIRESSRQQNNPLEQMEGLQRQIATIQKENIALKSKLNNVRLPISNIKRVQNLDLLHPKMRSPKS